MSLNKSKLPSLKDKLNEQEKALQAEAEAIAKAKARAAKEDNK